MKVLPVAVGALVAVLVGGLVVYEVHNRGSEPPPLSMLLTVPDGSARWSAARVHTNTHDNVATRNWAFGPEDFSELAYAYRSAGAAEHAFRTRSPDKTTRDVFAGARPDDIGARAAGADQAEFTCGSTESGQCTTWWAWLRFGTTDVLLMYRHTPEDAQALTDPELASVITHAADDLADLAR